MAKIGDGRTLNVSAAPSPVTVYMALGETAVSSRKSAISAVSAISTSSITLSVAHARLSPPPVSSRSAVLHFASHFIYLIKGQNVTRTRHERKSEEAVAMG